MVSIRSLALLGILMTEPLQAALLSPAETNQFNTRFEARQQATTSLRAQLVQTLKMAGLRDPLLSRGEILYRAPDQLLIRYTQPPGEFILLHGADVVVAKPPQPLRTVTLKPGQPGSEMLYFLGLFQDGGKTIRQDWNFSAETQAANVIVSLKPKSPLAEVLEIISHVRARDLEILSIQVRLPRGNTLLYDLKNVERNLPLSTKLFEVTP